MEAELVAEALAMIDVVFFENMIEELMFNDVSDSGPLYVNNTSALHVACNRTYSPRAQRIAMKYLFVQELVEDGTITIRYVKTQD